VTIEALVARYGVVAIFLGAGVVTGGVLAHQGLVSLAGAMAAAVIGSFVADQLFFAGGRYFRESRPVTAIRRRSAYARAIDLLERYPRRFIFAYRFVYGIRTVSPIAIGTSRISQRLFLAVNLAAAIVWGCVFSAIGYAFGNVIEEMLGRTGAGRLILFGAAALLAVGGGWFAWRKWRERSA
jgi:membrane protein DedA with SNARE-associated domain